MRGVHSSYGQHKPDRDAISCTHRRMVRKNGHVSQNNSAQVNRVSLQDVSRQRVANLFRMAWPSDSDRDTARQAAAFLGYSERAVSNWIDGTNSAPFDVVFAIGCKVGVFAVMEVMTEGQSRTSVLNLIAKGVRRVTG